MGINSNKIENLFITTTFKENKLFSKYTMFVNNKIHRIERVFKDGSGVEFEFKRCPWCRLKYEGCKHKMDYGMVISIKCPICKI